MLYYCRRYGKPSILIPQILSEYKEVEKLMRQTLIKVNQDLFLLPKLY
jgi:hypothetical protein